jgi:lysophospholipase L1-like esterase
VKLRRIARFVGGGTRVRPGRPRPPYTVAMEGEESSFYSVLQTSRVLGASLEEVHELINKGELEASYEEAGLRLIRARSVHACLKGSRSSRPQGSDEAAVTSGATSTSVSEVGHEENRGFDFELLVLLIIGMMTLLAAAYTLLPALPGGESVRPKETASTGAAGAATGGARSEETTAGTSTADQEETAPLAATSAPTGWVSAVGDSVMLGAVDALQQEIPNLALVDAQGSRQPPAAIDILRRRQAVGQLGDVVVVHVGNNGPFVAEQFDEMMRALAGMRKVLVVNATVPASVPDPIAVPNNAVLAAEVRRYPKNAVLVDWQAESAGHPEFFGEDDVHLTSQGAQAYADLIAAHLGDDAAESSAAPPSSSRERISWGEGGTFGECVGPSSWCNVPATP